MIGNFSSFNYQIYSEEKLTKTVNSLYDMKLPLLCIYNQIVLKKTFCLLTVTTGTHFLNFTNKLCGKLIYDGDSRNDLSLQNDKIEATPNATLNVEQLENTPSPPHIPKITKHICDSGAAGGLFRHYISMVRFSVHKHSCPPDAAMTS